MLNAYTLFNPLKIGVSTIAGGNVQKTGKADGPAQDATFSDDFELAFDPQRCALLISDHGNRLIRQLDLKTEDCANSSSGSGKHQNNQKLENWSVFSFKKVG